MVERDGVCGALNDGEAVERNGICEERDGETVACSRVLFTSRKGDIDEASGRSRVEEASRAGEPCEYVRGDIVLESVVASPRGDTP